MRIKGRITSWNDDKGFGFITPYSGGKRVFVHIKALNNRSCRPQINQAITYSLSTDKQGRSCAVKVALKGAKPQSANKQANSSLAVPSALLFLVVVGIATVITRMPLSILVIYLTASLLTFIVYAWDKSAAKRGAWRTQESTLHLLSLVGGWPGALIAQQKLRHKSKKKEFRVIFWGTVLVNCSVFVCLLTPTGMSALQSLIKNVTLLQSLTSFISD